MGDAPLNLPHLFVEGRAKTEPYRSEEGRGATVHAPLRDRPSHGRNLLDQLDQALLRARDRDTQRASRGISAGRGIVLEFASDPGLELVLKSLEHRSQGIELLSVRIRDGVECAVVFVPDDAVEHFGKLLNAYLEKESAGGSPKNNSFVTTISHIRIAVLESFWSDAAEDLPSHDRAIWWEVWLRRESVDEPPPELLRFRREAAGLGVQVIERSIPFPDRLVTLAHGTISQLASCTELLGAIAELRRAKQTPSDFFQFTRLEESEWVRDLADRMTPPARNAPAVCLLDTGVEREHPLLGPGIDPNDLHTLERAWGVNDHHGHGTELAGLCLHGDLSEPLVGRNPVPLGHWLESVKLLPPRGDNRPDLYGSLTTEAIARAEARAPERSRVTCVAVTTDGSDRGRPSSWSGAVDDLAAGTHDGERRLIVVSGGNAQRESVLGYPDANETDGVQDPAQAWNALSIGAFTEKTAVDDPGYQGWTPLARPGALSPWTTTSAIFGAGWPLKPDLVLEGGNIAVDPPRAQANEVDSLQLLTTSRRAEEFGSRRLLTTARGTSAAAALAAHMAATLWAEYPRLWPETVRALMVHSADWTQEMRSRYLTGIGRGARRALLRCCGFGVPSLTRASRSATNALTLVVQEDFQPFGRDDKKRPNMREMQFHPLPWPREELLALRAAPVEMKVTLSYFVEASPGQRGWRYRHRYASHGLRFDVKTPEESEDQFRHRLNRKAREDEDGRKETDADTHRWFLGRQLRSLGSLHSDRWTGTAVELAQRGLIGVYPVIGWWRERPDLGRLDRSARYALVVSIATPSIDVDLYSSVASQIGVEIPIEGEE